MKGWNQFNYSRLLEKRVSSNVIDCVFISYSRADKAQAFVVAEMIKDLGIDIYIDQNDQALQLADESNDHRKVVECIEDGITHCAVLLGIITENTKNSWWVPYEIGSANGHGRPHAHLITKEVRRLPSYIKASTILPSLDSLDEWLAGNVPDKKNDRHLFLERIERISRGHYKSASVDPVPMNRSISDLSFY